MKVAGNKTAPEVLFGPLVVPGVYTFRLTAGDDSSETQFEVVNDPRPDVSTADLDAQLALLISIRNKVSDAHRGVNRLRVLREQVQAWQKRLLEKADVNAAATAILEKLVLIEDALIQPGDQENIYGLIQRARLNAKLASIVSIVASADTAPTVQSAELADDYAAEIDAQLALLQAVEADDVSALNNLIESAGAPPIGD